MFTYLPILSNNSPPEAYSRNMYSRLASLRWPKNLMMCVSRSNRWMQTSLRKLARASGCFSRSTIFMATASPVLAFVRSFTLHKLQLVSIYIKFKLNVKTYSPYAPSPNVWDIVHPSTNSETIFNLLLYHLHSPKILPIMINYRRILTQNMKLIKRTFQHAYIICLFSFWRIGN